MLEFALGAPVFFLILFGIIEFGILLYDVTTTRFAASEAARVEALVGNQSVKCSDFTGCVQVYGAAKATMACDADCQAIVAVHKTPLGGLTLEQIDYIDVQKMTNPGTADSPGTKCQRYNFNGSLYTGSYGTCSGYPATTRGVVTGAMDYVQVNIHFTYNWLTSLLRSTAKSPSLDSKFVVRLEPQQFNAPPAPTSTPTPAPTNPPPPPGGCGDQC